MRKREHRTRSVAKEITQTLCAEPGCQFRGHEAVQGVCHTLASWTGVLPLGHKYFHTVWKEAERWVQEEKKLRAINRMVSAKKWIAHLEAQAVCHRVNEIMGLDELLHLRRELALTTRKLERLAGTKTTNRAYLDMDPRAVAQRKKTYGRKKK